MAGFTTIPAGGRYWLTDARVPASLIEGADGLGPADGDGLVRVDIGVDDGKIAAIGPAGAAADGPAVDLDGGQVWPGFVDLHTHLDKGHIWPRQENPDGSFGDALAAVLRDREHWTTEDVRRRMDFSLHCAYAHGTRAVRSHIDSKPPLDGISWPVFDTLRTAWTGRIDLQPVSLVGLDYFEDAEAAADLADTVARWGGLLGAVCYDEPEQAALLDRLFTLAAERDLDLDLHVDEGLDEHARSLEAVARTALRHDFKGRITCGHCCALGVQTDNYLQSLFPLLVDAEIAIVSLPMCNLYLQDRGPGRTPRQRGVTLLHELRSAGVPVAVASDNTRDPFYGFGDLDMLEVFREAVRIGHLDRPYGEWPRAATATPAAVMGLDDAGIIKPGALADLVLFRGRGFSELLSRPQHDRVVLRGGRVLDTTLPDYRELDDLFAESTDDRDCA